MKRRSTVNIIIAVEVIVIIVAIIAVFVLFSTDRNGRTGEKTPEEKVAAEASEAEESKAEASKTETSKAKKRERDNTEEAAGNDEDLAEQMMNGDFSGMLETDRISREDVQSVYKNMSDSVEFEWTFADMNHDGTDDLIWQEKKAREIGNPIIAIFDMASQGRCELWDTMDGTEYFFVTGNGKLVYHAPYFGTYDYVPYWEYEYDEAWNRTKIGGICAYYIYDLEELEGHTFDDMPEEGVYFWEYIGEEKTALKRTEFKEKFEDLTGKRYEDLADLPDHSWLKDLGSWTGDYSYTESFPHATDEDFQYFCGYEIRIYENNNLYYAIIEGEGWQLQTRTLARVSGNQESINLYFEETLQGDSLYGTCERYDSSEKLLSFQKGEELKTTWVALKQEHPTFCNEEEDVTGIYFEQEEKFWERIETDEEQAAGRYANNGTIEVSMERVDKSVYDEQGRLIATIYYDKPVVSGNAEVSAKINAFFDNEAQCFLGNGESRYISGEMYEQFLEGIGIMEERYGIDTLAEYPVSYVMNTRISYLDENVLGIMQIGTYRGEQTDFHHVGYTFNLATGEVMPITDFVDITPDEMRKIYDYHIDDEFDLYGELKGDNYDVTYDDKVYDMRYQYIYDGEYCYLIVFYGGRNYLCSILIRLEENVDDLAVFTCGTDWDGGDKIWWQKVG